MSGGTHRCCHGRACRSRHRRLHRQRPARAHAPSYTADLAQHNGSSASQRPVPDVVALGNLCVDVIVDVRPCPKWTHAYVSAQCFPVLPGLDTYGLLSVEPSREVQNIASAPQVDELPSSDEGERRQLLESLSVTPPQQGAWQLGGSTNFMIAAARLGLNVCSCGHVGQDAFGTFLMSMLKVRPADSDSCDSQRPRRGSGPLSAPPAPNLSPTLPGRLPCPCHDCARQ
jgi:hypothetical protein